MTYFALVDCNNFYASCERAFDNALRNRPVVVLSNNDGCVIARSQEAKAIGIPMGEPYFKVKPLIQRSGVVVRSSNYTLYGDMSGRVMSILKAHCADVEVYSIDEAFLALRFHKMTEQSLSDYACKLRQTILQATGIPVSIGIARTKTLAKLANHLAKKQCREGVCLVNPDSPMLHHIDIADIWGVGKAYQRRLRAIGVHTVTQLAKLPEGWMRKEFGVVGLRLLKELNGMACHTLEPPIEKRKNTMVSRSFKTEVTDKEILCEAVANYATRLGEKLRQYKQATPIITVYLWTNRFKQRTHQQHSYAQSVGLPMATSNTDELICWALAVTRCLYRQGIAYKKAGILAHDLVSDDQVQTSLFASQHRRKQSAAVMQAVDTLNKKMGRGTVYYAVTGLNHSDQTKSQWRMRSDLRSNCFTTRWEELLIAR